MCAGALGGTIIEVLPGLYGVGSPSVDSPVLVTANYKLTFDILRRDIKGLDAWILVIDTKGVNVWCSAGKGTFSADEIVRRIESSRLAIVAKTRTLILPQLSAPGVAAHEITRKTGYKVVYGPVRSSDIKEFIFAGKVKTAEMSRVHFGLIDRMRVVGVEVGAGLKHILGIIAAYVFIYWISARSISTVPFWEIAPVVGAFLVGAVVFPALLPLNVFRSFAAGGAFLGAILAAGCIWMYNPSILGAVSLGSLLPAISGFAAINYTGSTTFTSLAGVKREMRIALPLLIAAAVVGVLSGIARLVI